MCLINLTVVMVSQRMSYTYTSIIMLNNLNIRKFIHQLYFNKAGKRIKSACFNSTYSKIGTSLETEKLSTALCKGGVQSCVNHSICSNKSRDVMHRM